MNNFSTESFDEACNRVHDMDAPLNEQLRAFADAVRQWRPDFADAVDRLVERLRVNGAGTPLPTLASRCRRSSYRTIPGAWSASTIS